MSSGPIVFVGDLPLPRLDPLIGRAVTLEPLAPAHMPDLWDAARSADESWTYLRYGPFATDDALADHIARISGRADQPFFAIRPATSGRAEGWASFCDIAPADGVIEIGSVWFSPRLQRTRASTEALFLMMRHAFSLGYHRLVWRCNAANAASVRAAERLGFTREGTWRGDCIVKGRRRDTAWFSILDNEWPALEARVADWLQDDNFDAEGRARRSLSSATRT